MTNKNKEKEFSKLDKEIYVILSLLGFMFILLIIGTIIGWVEDHEQFNRICKEEGLSDVTDKKLYGNHTKIECSIDNINGTHKRFSKIVDTHDVCVKHDKWGSCIKYELKKVN
jgi:hypothetical protein